MARQILGGAIVPAAPALLPELSPRQPDEIRDGLAALRADVDATLAALPDADVVLVLDAGQRGVHQRARADMAGLGVPGVGADLPVPVELTAAVTRVTQYPLVAQDQLPVSAGVIVTLLERARGRCATVVTSVPARAEASVLQHVGAGLVEAIRGSTATGVVVASGDLSAALTEHSPGYRVEGAEHWDRELLEGIKNGSAGAVLRALGPERATLVKARSWPAIVAADGAFTAARLRRVACRYHAPLGVGQLVARYEPHDIDEPGGRFRRSTTSA